MQTEILHLHVTLLLPWALDLNQLVAYGSQNDDAIAVILPAAVVIQVVETLYFHVHFGDKFECLSELIINHDCTIDSRMS